MGAGLPAENVGAQLSFESKEVLRLSSFHRGIFLARFVGGWGEEGAAYGHAAVGWWRWLQGQGFVVSATAYFVTRYHRPRGVTVSTLDSESSDRGSNAREAFASALPLPCLFYCLAKQELPL